MIVALETCKALLRAAEADAAPNRFGLVTPAWAPLNACRNWYPRLYPRLRRDPAPARRERADGAADGGRRVRPGARGRRALPPERDARRTERLRLFRLAWDTCLSAFAGRQSLYEYFFFGDPVRMAGALVASYDREPYKQRVRDFMRRED